MVCPLDTNALWVTAKQYDMHGIQVCVSAQLKIKGIFSTGQVDYALPSLFMSDPDRTGVRRLVGAKVGSVAKKGNAHINTSINARAALCQFEEVAFGHNSGRLSGATGYAVTNTQEVCICEIQSQIPVIVSIVYRGSEFIYLAIGNAVPQHMWRWNIIKIKIHSSASKRLS